MYYVERCISLLARRHPTAHLTVHMISPTLRNVHSNEMRTIEYFGTHGNLGTNLTKCIKALIQYTTLITTNPDPSQPW